MRRDRERRPILRQPAADTNLARWMRLSKFLTTDDMIQIIDTTHKSFAGWAARVGVFYS
jgi:hypothetical protein